jgi:thymidylate synthase (FAD)
MDAATLTTAKPLRTVREPRVFLVGRQTLVSEDIDRFLGENELTWKTDTEVGAEALAEMAGRVCYMSYGKGRKTNAEFLGHIVEVGHGSVLEHAVWSFLLTGVSRSFTHELIRPPALLLLAALAALRERVGLRVRRAGRHRRRSRASSRCGPRRSTRRARLRSLVEGCRSSYATCPRRRLRRKLARQAARSVLPNATETKIFVTGNARALRHFIEMRGSEHADVEIRKVALAMLEIMQQGVAGHVRDYESARPMARRRSYVATRHPKV